MVGQSCPPGSPVGPIELWSPKLADMIQIARQLFSARNDFRMSVQVRTGMISVRRTRCQRVRRSRLDRRPYPPPLHLRVGARRFGARCTTRPGGPAFLAVRLGSDAEVAVDASTPVVTSTKVARRPDHRAPQDRSQIAGAGRASGLAAAGGLYTSVVNRREVAYAGVLARLDWLGIAAEARITVTAIRQGPNVSCSGP